MDSRQLLRELPRRTLFGLGALAALRAVALVLLAGGVASAIAQLAAGRTDIVPACALAAAGGLARALLGWALSASTARAAAREKARQRGELIGAVADGRASGAEIATVATTGLDALDDFWLSTVPAAVGAATVPIVVGLRILSADWLSALIVVITLPLVPLFMILIGLHSRDRTAEATTALERLADYLVDLAAGLPVLVGLGRVGEQRRALARVQQRYSARTRQTLRTALLSALALELIGTISVAVVAVSLGIRLLNHSVALEPALLALLLAPECFAAVREVGAAFHSSQRGLTVLDRVRGLLGSSVRSREGSGGEIVLDLRSLRYADRDAAPVGPIALRVAPGTITALVGPSGSGKSSALAALTGTLPEDAVLEGSALAPAAIAVARQDPRFSAATVRAELALHGDGGPQLAGRLGLGALLDADPVSLSPGEQRRLAVARALLRVDAGAQALLLDEPTAHLDAASAEALLAEIDARRARCAILIATHDPDAIALADDVVRVARRDVSPDEPPVSTDSVPSRAVHPENGADDPKHDPEHVGSSRWRWVASCALAVLAAGFALALTGVSGWLIVRASQGPAIMYLLVAIVGVRFFGIGRAALRYSERLVEHDAALRMTDALRLRLWSAIAARGTGSRRLLEGGTATDVLVVRLERMRDLLPRVIPPIVTSLVCGAGVIVVAGLVTPTALPLTAACVAVGAIAGPAVALLVDRRAVVSTEEARSRLARELGALGHAAVELRVNGVADTAAAAAREATESARAAEQRAALGSGLGVALVVLACSTLAALAPLAAASARPELAAVTALLGLALVDPLLAGAQAAQRAPGLLAARAALHPLLSAPPERTDGGTVDERLESVELVDVGIRWPGADRLAVRGVDAVLERSAWTVLDGPSGSGKSTLLSAILGAIDPVEGRIEYDGVPGALLAPAAIRTHVAWCPQDAHVFDSTLRGNLLISRPREDPPSDPAMRTALHRVGLGSFAADLETRIGRDGSRLSGGERQRLAVARALLSPAETLLLDEPTAHLDAATAAEVMEDVRDSTADRIVVLVSHRADDRRPGDRIVSTDAPHAQRARR